jgi:hypothetical protein
MGRKGEGRIGKGREPLAGTCRLHPIVDGQTVYPVS